MTRTALLFLSLLIFSCQSYESADLIISGGDFWTGSDEISVAEALAVKNGRIIAIGSNSDINRYRGSSTRFIDATGNMVIPGFIDNHTHFNRAGELLMGINLLDVSDSESLRQRIQQTNARMPDGMWITGGMWGAYEQWEMGATGNEQARAEPWTPHRNDIDDLTPNRPVLLNRWDGGLFLANTAALELAGADCSWNGVKCEEGSMTGILNPEAAERIRNMIPEPDMKQRLAEARLALRDLAKNGVTTFHDITGEEQMRVFQELKRRGELTARVYARPTLDKWEHLAALGMQHGFGDYWIRTGGLKGFVDGIMGNSSARFYEPYLTSGERGRWRDMMYPPGNMQKLIVNADAHGLWPQIHAIGDQAIDSLLNMYEHAIEVNGPKDRRFRLIHTQVLRDASVAARMAELDIIAEMQPYHAIDDMRWMEERIGERARWAYAFNTLHEAGVTLSFGSDWPGTNASWYPSSAIEGIYAAVTRQTLDGEPQGGWFPEERIDVQTALRAYTVNNAWAEGLEDVKGKLEIGMLADIVILSDNLLEMDPFNIKNVEVLMTIVGGKIVFEAGK